MSSEHTLWENIRDNIGHAFHFTRIEFNIVDGIPDVCFCRHGVEGFIELKHCHAPPARVNTCVFGPAGLRDSQVRWIFKRTRAGGRVWILAQIGATMYLVPGVHCRRFNNMTLHEISKVSEWHAGVNEKNVWNQLTEAITA